MSNLDAAASIVHQFLIGLKWLFWWRCEVFPSCKMQMLNFELMSGWLDFQGSWIQELFLFESAALHFDWVKLSGLTFFCREILITVSAPPLPTNLVSERDDFCDFFLQYNLPEAFCVPHFGSLSRDHVPNIFLVRGFDPIMINHGGEVLFKLHYSILCWPCLLLSSNLIELIVNLLARCIDQLCQSGTLGLHFV